MYNLFCITQRRKMNILKYLIYIIHVSVYTSAIINKIYKHKTYVCFRQYTRIQENARYLFVAEIAALQLLDSLIWLIQIFRFSELKARINHIKKSYGIVAKLLFLLNAASYIKKILFLKLYMCVVCVTISLVISTA